MDEWQAAETVAEDLMATGEATANPGEWQVLQPKPKRWIDTRRAVESRTRAKEEVEKKRTKRRICRRSKARACSCSEKCRVEKKSGHHKTNGRTGCHDYLARAFFEAPIAREVCTELPEEDMTEEDSNED